MIGGFLKGVLAGGAVGTAALVVLSVLAEAPPSSVPPDLGSAAGAPVAPIPPEDGASGDGAAPAAEAGATVPAPAAAAQPAVAEAAPATNKAPAAAADAPQAVVTPDAPAAAEVAGSGAPLASGEAASAPPAAPAQPAQPAGDPAPAVAEAPPSPAPDEALLAPQVKDLAVAPPEIRDPAPILPEAETAALPEAAALRPLAPPAAEAVPELADPPPQLAQAAPGTAEPAPDLAPVQAPVQTPEPPATPEPEPAPEPIPASEAEDAGLAKAPPVPGLGAGAEGVTTNRLPQIGDAPDAPTAGTDAPVVDAGDPADLPPMLREARPFENPEQKPLFVIILIDSGATDLDRAALAALPFPVSFALDPMDPGTPARAAAYRAAGQEVLMLASGLPEGAEASDVEVAMAVMGDALPQAVAVIDTPVGAFQNDRPLATSVIPVVASQGRGVVTWDRGLNAADQVARRDAVPAAVIFRALDAEGESVPVIRRYLDRAAFKAAQEGRVVVAGNTRPETVAALMEWAVEGRSATVALAPVTAVLTLP